MTIAVRPPSRRRRPSSILRLGVDVDVRGRLVEHEDARVGDQRAGERDELALAGGELGAALADLGVVAVLQRDDEVVGADRPRGVLDLLRRGVDAAERDVVADRAAEQERLLGHDPHLRAQRGRRHVAQVVAVDEDAAGGRVVEARDELGQRRLAGAGRADQRDRLAGRHGQVDVAQRLALAVGEDDVIERDLAAQPRQLVRRRRRGRAPGRAARRSCRARPCRPGRSCRAARAAGSGRRSCSARRRRRPARRPSRRRGSPARRRRAGSPRSRAPTAARRRGSRRR